jgi:uncharacterized membrane protein
MNIFILSIISLAIILYLKDNLNLFFYIKIYLGYPSTEEVKPFDCYFCLIMWTFIIVAIVSLNWVMIPIGFVTAKIIDKLWS